MARPKSQKTEICLISWRGKAPEITIRKPRGVVNLRVTPGANVTLVGRLGKSSTGHRAESAKALKEQAEINRLTAKVLERRAAVAEVAAARIRAEKKKGSK